MTTFKQHAPQVTRLGIALLCLLGACVAPGAVIVQAATNTFSDQPPAVCHAHLAGQLPCSGWQRRDPWSGREAAIEEMSFHPLAQPADVLVQASWIRTADTDIALYPGYKGPGVISGSRGPEMVPPSSTTRLLATFNSGFYEADNPAGFYTHNTLYFPMVKGEATLLAYRNGTVGIATWQGGPRPGPRIAMARQNLTLLVDAGRPTPASMNNALWGATLGGAPAVWRSALGIDAHGNLIYAAAPAQTSASLASVMVQLHCVRALELDINPEWPIFVTYGARGAQDPHLDVANPNQIPGRFLYPSTKDFFAVFTRRLVGEPPPW